MRVNEELRGIFQPRAYLSSPRDRIHAEHSFALSFVIDVAMLFAREDEYRRYLSATWSPHVSVNERVSSRIVGALRGPSLRFSR